MTPTRQALHAFKWSALAEAASKAIGPLIFLVLARLLLPEDFGVVAAATVVVSFSQLFSNAGLGKALIQRQDRTGDSANVVFWCSLLIGLFLTVLLCATAPWIAAFFKDSRIAPVVRVLSLQILLSAFSATHISLLQKSLQFKSLFWVRLLTVSLPALASIPLAVAGYGYWALVWGNLTGQLVQSLLLWRMSEWRPRTRIDRALAIELLGFGKWAMLSGLLGWFYSWMDTVIVGHYLGSHDMGMYRTGNSLITMGYGLIFAPMLPVLYSLFSRAQHDLPGLRAALSFVIHAIALTALPLGFFLFISGDNVGELLFRPEWSGIGNVIGTLGLMHAFSWLAGANGEAYRAIGKPHVETWVGFAMLPIYLATYIASVHLGLDAFLDARLALSLTSLLAHILVANKVLHIPFSNFAFFGIVCTSATAAILASSFDSGLGSATAQLLVKAAIFTAILAAGMALFERAFLRKVLTMVFPGFSKQARH